jgi:hypothetical protein
MLNSLEMLSSLGSVTAAIVRLSISIEFVNDAVRARDVVDLEHHPFNSQSTTFENTSWILDLSLSDSLPFSESATQREPCRSMRPA